MKTKILKNGFSLPVLSYGTYKLGGKFTRDTAHDDEHIQAIQTAVETGFKSIDTAEIYGDGHAEELVGQAIKKYDRRKIFLTSKVSDEHLHYNDVLKSMDNSLKRLQTDYLDLYLVHFPNPDVPLEETMKAMNELVDAGKTKWIGVSNFTVADMKEAQKYSKHKIVCNQAEYSLLARNRGKFTRDMESEIIPYCREHDMLYVAYRPIAQGLLTKNGYKLLDEMAEKYKTTVTQVALNWVISQENVVAIVKSEKAEHIQDNYQAATWELTREDVELLNKNFTTIHPEYAGDDYKPEQ